MFKIVSAKQAIFVIDQLNIVIDSYLAEKGWKAQEFPQSEPYPSFMLYTQDGRQFFSQRNALEVELQNGTRKQSTL